MEPTRTRLTDTLVVFCGGTGMHWFAKSVPLNSRITFIVPSTDNGGSSRAIIDAIGGPAVGDLRNISLAVARSMQENNSDKREPSLVSILGRRLTAAGNARAELDEVMDGVPGLISAPLWRFIRAAPSGFDFRGACVGNLVLAGMMLESMCAPFAAFAEAAVRFTHDLLRIPKTIRICPACEFIPEVTSGPNPHLLLPRLDLYLRFEDGAEINGQTAISYGVDGGVKDGSRANDDEPTASPERLWVEIAGSLEPAASLSSTTKKSTDESPDRALLPYCVVLGCGSFLTSTLASAATVRVRLPENARITLFLNATTDRETSFAFRGTHANDCTCAHRLSDNPVVRLARVARRCITWLREIPSVGFYLVVCAKGSAFEDGVQLLDELSSRQSNSRREVCGNCDCQLREGGLVSTIFLVAEGSRGYFDSTRVMSRVWPYVWDNGSHL